MLLASPIDRCRWNRLPRHLCPALGFGAVLVAAVGRFGHWSPRWRSAIAATRRRGSAVPRCGSVPATLAATSFHQRIGDHGAQEYEADHRFSPVGAEAVEDDHALQRF